VVPVPEWTTVVRVEDLPEGEMLGTMIDGVDVLVANVHGEYRAIGSECTHAGCKLHEDGELDEGEGVVTCLCHGSVFDLQTGEAVGPPAEEAVPVYRVRVAGGQIQVARPEA
jgi:nitrite reductase/ring-hydroxylating ferredoxin subunit